MTIPSHFFPVHFVYLDLSEPKNDREWDAFCVALPRKGDMIRPHRDLPGHVVVREIIHRFCKLKPSDTKYYQVIAVAVSDPNAKWPDVWFPEGPAWSDD